MCSTQTLLLPLSRFSRVRLCGTPKTAAHQAPVPGIFKARTLEGFPGGSVVKNLPAMQETQEI